ncbi:MAG: citramalate synthase, partial [Bifidobacteriaceae bacterium]|nr:citramalate synthase [Bifidobacteriaceae bacterium]
TEFFQRLAKEVTFRHATLAAFGSTRKAGGRAATDPQVRALLDAETPVVTLVAKSDIRHVERALKTTPAENLAMIGDTVSFLAGEGRRVFLDAEHFFDGYRHNPAYALECAQTASDAGAEVVVLCDTNGGMLPPQVARIVAEVKDQVGAHLGIHCHNDTGCAVANSLAAVEAGAIHVQGTVNGYGERTGNADLTSIIPNLALKLGVAALAPAQLEDLTAAAHAISEVTNIAPFARQPYVGVSAFAHKAGLHASAIRVDPDLYQHIDPLKVGNDRRMLVSEMAGRASVELKGKELGFDLAGQGDVLTRVTDRVKALEAEGYTFDAADASFELLLRSELPGGRPEYFRVESWRTISETLGGSGAAFSQAGAVRADGGAASGPADTASEATVKLWAGDQRFVATGEGNGPVNALDAALRAALAPIYPELARIELVDYKVRILDSARGTDAVTRVMIESTGGAEVWRTVGVGPNIIEASWEALTDAFAYGLMKADVPPR